ncbi:MAG: creatininase family protein [Pseudomonadota bacterium]
MIELQDFLIGWLGNWGGVFLPSSRIFALYMLAALVLAALNFWWFARHTDRAERPAAVDKGLIGYVFDADVYYHRSATQDYVYFFLNGVLFYGILSQLIVGTHVLYGVFGEGLDWAFGVREAPMFEASIWSAAAYTLVAVLALDFAVFLSHYAHHRLPWLWPFHAVHHSAEVLTPMTLFRMHPVDLFLTGSTVAVLTAAAFALFVWMTGEEPAAFTVMGLNVGLFAFYLLGYNLRHSHIWLSYPRWLSYLLISPAQHQTHHSVDERHIDRNFGLIFAFWDWMFGTLYVPRGYEKLTFGLTRAAPNPFASVPALFVLPFADAGRALWRSLRSRPAVTLLLVGGIGGAVIGGLRTVGAADQPSLPSLRLERLTWTEVAAAQAAGFDTVIVPTGGTEQNGPHAVLGKHNLIVAETSERIASALGNALVAPVMAYVPQGAVGANPTGHMQWPGTLSLPEGVFEAVLEATVRSLQTHGFLQILLVGDSRDSQAAQARVAERLDAAWPEVRVIQVGAYYAANGQAAWLTDQGWGDAEIGTHAGIRDTSELMAVAPGAVRTDPVPAPFLRHSGVDGAPAMATAEIGERMLALKVEAALAQIQRELGLPLVPTN